MAYLSPNTMVIASDKSAYLERDPATNFVNLVNQGVTQTLANASGVMAQKRTIVADALAVTLTADQSGALCVFDKTDGAAFTLPAAEAGLWFDFVIVVAPSSVGHRVACASGDFILGSIFLDDGDTGLTTTAQAFNGSSHLAIDMNAATDGWLAGGFFRLTAISGTQWVIHGHLLHTGNVASPAATS